MHHFQATNGTHFNYNPDLSGGVEVKTAGDTHGYWVSGTDLAEFLWECYEKRRRIAELEATDWKGNR